MNIKNIVIGIAIMILTLFVVMYGINMFYSQPEYEDFCDTERVYNIMNNETACLDAGGKWTDYQEIQKNPEDITRTGYCNEDYYCREEYQEASERYYKNIFLITLPLGIIIILLGMFMFGLEAVGSGLMAGGVLSIIYGVGGYWRYSEDVLKFTLSLIGLIIVIFAAYKFNKTGTLIFKKKKGKKK